MLVVYRARPKISRTQNWGLGESEAREGLADVIKIHEMLTNQISTGRFRLVVFIACGLLRAMAALYKSEQVLPVADSRVSTEQSLFTCAVENGLRKLGYDRIKPDANSCCSVRC